LYLRSEGYCKALAGHTCIGSTAVLVRLRLSLRQQSVCGRERIGYVALTYHLAPGEVWERQRSESHYTPEAFESEGFIHCTDSLQLLIDVGNRYYTSDRREMVCLVVELDQVAAEVRYEDPEHVYPHIYGPLETGAVVDVRQVQRDDDGLFVAIR
jgi:uncharacterized protein (DUF952 family)